MRTVLKQTTFFFILSFCFSYCIAQSGNSNIVYKVSAAGLQENNALPVAITTTGINYKKFDTKGNLIETGIFECNPPVVSADSVNEIKTGTVIKSETEYLHDKSGYTEVQTNNFFKNDRLCSVTKSFYGYNGRLLRRYSKNLIANQNKSEQYFYDRKGRLVKIMYYNDGRLKEYTTLQYNES